MNIFFVAVFDSEAFAYEGLSILNDLHGSGDITLYATAIVAKEASRTFRVRHTSGDGPIGLALDRLMGSVLSWHAAPIGATYKPSAESMAELISDLTRAGVSLDFLSEVSQALAPGKAAVLAEVQETWAIPVDARLNKIGGQVLKRQRTELFEDQLQHDAAWLTVELKQRQAEMVLASAAHRAALQKEVDNIKHKLETTLAAAEAGQEQTKSEAAAKLSILGEQLKLADERQKTKIDGHVEEVKTEYETRRVKLGQTLKFIRDAMNG